LSFKDKLKQKNNLLSAITEQTVEEVKNPVVIKILEWDINEINRVWQQFYTEKINSEAQKSVYKTAKLSLGEDGDKLYVEVPSLFNKDEIQRNSALINELKTNFGKSALMLVFNVVEPPEITEQRRRAALSVEDRKKENEQPYLEQNPLLQKLKDVLGLELKK